MQDEIRHIIIRELLIDYTLFINPEFDNVKEFVDNYILNFIDESINKPKESS